ncbi:MAG: tRNA lysidine(34) synthetase TilS [Bacteroidota bacterium]|nr:tRNA lysidine(34) synthetase TilS [Odoribacter sp.]MDP3644954.1 tRNA lysidine(34) synthetase TilS [Bacteroidota bacterium]
MVEQFLKYIHEENLFHSSQRILLAVSGGADSMLMLHLFANAGFSVAVAHCNFGLRGKESDGDEQFVADYCEMHNLAFYVKHFKTQDYALEKGISIEMAARDLRYSWFDGLLVKHGLDFLATAHHQDDVIETFLINLSRGSGIKGLSGIQPKSGRIIRPMLFTNQTEILDYCQRLKINFRTDSSNMDTVYKRNLIRQDILPLLEQVNPAFRKNALKTIGTLHETGQLFQQRMSEIRAFVYSEDDQGAMVHIEKLQTLSPLRTILFELIREFGFQIEQINDILDSMNRESGRKFFSGDYRLVKDREYLLISPFHQKSDQFYYIDEDCTKIQIPKHLSFEKFERTADFRFSTHLNAVDLDLDRLIFPLILRHWQEGEYFQPLGMKGLKKLSDFFIDEKYSIPDKENAWILASGNRLVWIVGKRLDDRFKITSKTKRILRIRLA